METAVRVEAVQHQPNPQLCGCVPPSPTYRPVCWCSGDSWVLFPRLWRAEWAKTTNKSMVHKGHMGRTRTQKNSHPTSRKST